jgi:hypothetical protein
MRDDLVKSLENENAYCKQQMSLLKQTIKELKGKHKAYKLLKRAER